MPTRIPRLRACGERAVAAGLADVEVAQDGCGRLRVFVDDVSSSNAARALSVARAAALEPTVEADTDG